MESKKPKTLKRELGPITAVFVVINMVIGSGIFFKASQVVELTKAPGAAIAALLIAGIITVFGGLTTSELTASIPKTGGMVVWLEEAFGPFLGFLCGWTFSVIAFPAFIAALATAFGSQFVAVFEVPESWGIFIGLGATIFLTAMNAAGTKFGGAITNIFTIGKLIPVAFLIIFGFAFGKEGVANLGPMTASDGSTTIAAFGAALLACMYVYDGWLQVGIILGDMKNPKRDLPRAIVFGLSLLTVIFVLMFSAYLFVLPSDVLASSATPATDVAVALVGKTGAKAIGIGIMVSLFGALSQNIFIAPRVLYSMGVQNKLPFSDKFASLSKSARTPVFGYSFIAVLVIAYTMTGSYNVLTDIATFSLWFFYTLTFLAVIALRKKQPDLERPIKVPFYPVLPLIAAAGGTYIFISFIINTFTIALISIGLVAIGIPLYLFRKDRFKDASVLDVDLESAQNQPDNVDPVGGEQA